MPAILPAADGNPAPGKNLIMRAAGLSRTLTGELTVQLVRGASLDVFQGEFLSITGPSGSGKSSLLYLLGLLDRPTAGTLQLEGRETTVMTDNELAAQRLSRLGFIFQFHFLLPEFTARENVMLPMQRLGKLSPVEIRDRADMLLADLGLADQAKKRPSQLSGGQCQRVAIARALANDPALLLADEPTGNLDTVSSQNVQKILRELAHKHNRAVIAVTHDIDFANLADRRVHIVDGRIMDAGTY